MSSKNKLHASGEDYLETILVLQKKRGMVRSVDCPKCKHETLIAVRKLNLSIIQEPDAQTQSR